MARILDVNTFFGLSRHGETEWSLDDLLRLLDRHGIERALTASLRGAHYDFIGGNEDTLAAARAHPNLIPAATIHPTRYLGCLEEVRRCVGEGMTAFRFWSEHQGGWGPTDLHFLRVAEEIAAAGGRAILLRADRNGWPSALARHLGGLEVAVVMLGVTYPNLGEALAAMKAAPNLCCDGVQFDTPWAYETAIAEVGVERLVFGTGLPWRYFSSAYEMVARAEITDAQREAILWGNAARILGLEG
jgi:hypothetical protein